MDTSWSLTVRITDIALEKRISVTSGFSIVKVVHKLVQELPAGVDFSTHLLWWPERRQWLTEGLSTLDRYGIDATALLEFTPRYRPLHVILPDLEDLTLIVDFSAHIVDVVDGICAELRVSQPEEFSLMKKPVRHSRHHLRRGGSIRGSKIRSFSSNTTKKNDQHSSAGKMRSRLTSETLNQANVDYASVSNYTTLNRPPSVLGIDRIGNTNYYPTLQADTLLRNGAIDSYSMVGTMKSNGTALGKISALPGSFRTTSAAGHYEVNMHPTRNKHYTLHYT